MIRPVDCKHHIDVVFELRMDYSAEVLVERDSSGVSEASNKFDSKVIKVKVFQSTTSMD